MEPHESIALTRCDSHSVEGNTVLFHVVAGDYTVPVSLSLYDGGIVRYRLLPRDPVFDLVAPEALAAPSQIEVRREADRVEITNGAVRVSVSLNPWYIEIFKKGDIAPRVVELPTDIDAHGGVISEPTGYCLVDGSPHTTRLNLALDPHASFFGLGEKHDDLNKRGRRLVCWNVNPYGAGRETAYKNIPFLASTRGYALFLNETCRSEWDIGATSNFSLGIDVDNGSFDLFVLIADGLKQQLARYADLTGHAGLPPRWSFGLWISPFGEQRLSATGMNQEEILELAVTIRERSIPCDVIHLDPYWMGDEKLCHFQWDRDHYPDPPALVRALKEKGFRVCLWEHPYLEKGGEIYEEAAREGYLLKRDDGSVYDTELAYIPPGRRVEYSEAYYAMAGIVDFSNAEAVEWYKAKHRPHLEMGVATFKSDFGEMIPRDAVFANGRTGREMHNLYPLLYNQAVFEVIGEYQERPVVWGRSGYAGSQRYPIQWSGDPLTDFKSLVATIRAGLSYGLSGVPFWTFDLGGFKGQPTTPAYVRWAQIGLLLSHSRFHGTTPRLPWYYGEEAEAIVRDFIRLRYRLLPAIYAAAAEAVSTGVPVMRALALEFPDDPGSVATDLEFLLGPSLLVVPVLNEQGQAEVYLPPGGWYDYFSGERLMGPRRFSRECSLRELPIYVRETAILPFGPDESTVSDLWDPLGFDVYPAAAGTMEIPEEYGRPATQISVLCETSDPIVRGDGPERSWIVRLRDVTNPRHVDVGGAQTSSWTYDARSRTVEIRVGPCVSFEAHIRRG